MDMLHLLSSVTTRTEEQFIPFLGNIQVPCDIPRDEDHPPYEQRIPRLKIIDRLDLPLRDDKDMYRSQRMDVFESENLLILIDDIGGDFLPDDF